jgi:hypothetical protein
MSPTGEASLRKYGVILVAIAVVLAGMKALGSYAKGSGLSASTEETELNDVSIDVRDSGPDTLKHPPVAFRLAGMGVGAGSLAKTGFKLSPTSKPVAVWARFMGSGPGSGPLDFHMRALVENEKGEPWPFQTVMVGRDAVIMIAPGYAKAPKGLFATILVDNIQAGKYRLPALPPPAKVAPPKLGGTLQGISAKQDGQWIAVHAQLPAGHRLGVRAIGNEFGSGAVSGGLLQPMYEPGSKGREGSWRAAPMLNYPSQDQTLYLEVSDLAPVQRHESITFPPVPVVERFGRRWLTQEEVTAKVGGGIEFRISNEYSPPRHKAPHTPPVKLRFSLSRGVVDALELKGVSPATYEGDRVFMVGTSGPQLLGGSGTTRPTPLETKTTPGPRFTVNADFVSFEPASKTVIKVPFKGIDFTRAIRAGATLGLGGPGRPAAI